MATANGAGALIAALNALEIGPKDEVLVTPNTFIATVNAILATYALPVFVDTDLKTQLIDATKLEAAITSPTLKGRKASSITPAETGFACHEPLEMRRSSHVGEITVHQRAP